MAPPILPTTNYCGDGPKSQGATQGIRLSSVISLFSGIGLAAWKRDPLVFLAFFVSSVFIAITSGAVGAIITDRRLLNSKKKIQNKSQPSDISAKAEGAFRGFAAGLPMVLLATAGIVLWRGALSGNSSENTGNISELGFDYAMTGLFTVVDGISAARAAHVTAAVREAKADDENSSEAGTARTSLPSP